MKTHHEMRLRQDPPELFHFVVLRVAGDFFQDLQVCVCEEKKRQQGLSAKEGSGGPSALSSPLRPPRPPVPGVTAARCAKFTPKQPGDNPQRAQIHAPPTPPPQFPPKSAQPMGGRARTSSLCPSSSSGHFGVMSASVMYRLTGECSVWLRGGGVRPLT